MTKIPSVLILFLIQSSSWAFGNVKVNRVERSQSRLVIEFNNNEDVRWVLRAGDHAQNDAQRIPCVEGKAAPGVTRLDQDKISSPSDIEFVVFDKQGKLLLQENYPGMVRPSALEKVKGAARIYQLEVRTYFAKGTGQEKQGRLKDLTTERLRELAAFGVDYLWLTGVIEHGTPLNTDSDVIKGEAGSYYGIFDKWDVANGLGDLSDLDALIERAHGAGVRVLLDFVANHTARGHKTDVIGKCGMNFGAQDTTSIGFSNQNNYYYLPGQSFVPPGQSLVPSHNGLMGRIFDGLYDTDLKEPGIQSEFPAKATGNDIFSGTPSRDDWYETAKLNYGWDYQRNQGVFTPTPATWFQMVDVGKYWLAKGVDGFRVDFAHSVPMEFWRFFVGEIRRDFPNAFLLAEAYESDLRMKLPGFSYKNLLDAGFDSVYESSAYWKMRSVAERPWTMNQTGLPGGSIAFNQEFLQKGFMLTRYMENHDEIRVASRFFSPNLDRYQRSQLGWAMTAYLGLLPGHLLLHGGQELAEDAEIFGSFAGDNGRTSIFDFVFQDKVNNWLQGLRQDGQVELRKKYASLLKIKSQIPFHLPDQKDQRTFIDLMGINLNRFQSQWINAYVRYSGQKRFIVVTNTDPINAHEATIHFTRENNRDSDGILQILGISNDGTRYRFKDQLFRSGWEPTDPGGSVGLGFPGWVLYQAGGIPSGLYLGWVPQASTLVLEVAPANELVMEN